MKSRKQIDEKYKWDLELFKTQEEIDKVFNDMEYLTKVLPEYNNKFANKEKFFEYHTKFKKQNQNIENLAFYISNTLNVDNSNVEILKLKQRFEIAYSKLNKAISFVSPQIDDLPNEYLESLLKDSRSKNLNNMINRVIKEKKHKLDEQTSKILSEINNSFANSHSIFNIFTNSEMPFDDAVDSKGKSFKVDNSTFSKYISSKDRKLRESAYNSTMNAYGKYNKTFAELFIKDMKADNDFSKLKKYNSLLEYCLNDEEIPELVFNNNIEYINKNVSILQEFIKELSKKSGLEKFSYYDLFEDKKISGKITLDKGKKIMLSALAPLGKEYTDLVSKKLIDKSIDYMPNKNKRSGAYCSDSYGAKTLILMNWTDDYNSLSTLCHEMGHCINAEYYNTTQPQEKAGITIFAAEIASTVNEILLNQYMLNNSKTNKEKLYYLKEFLNDVRTTIFRQTLFAEFEVFAHSAIENETPITYQELNKKYYELNKKYYGKSCILPKNLQYEWSRIPHFYSPYYVYCYSTGLICAISIASNILKDSTFVEKYIQFLKNGTNKPPVEMLKQIGINLEDGSAFKNAFNFIKEKLDIYKTLK